MSTARRASAKLPRKRARRRDAEHYNYFRDYDPSIGRYVESDPLGVALGPDTYSYVDSRPLDLTDAFGLCPCDVHLPSGPVGEVALVCFSEATSHCKDAWFEKVAITDTIFNRASANRSYWGGSDISDVIQRPGQFVGVGGKQWNKGMHPEKLSPGDCSQMKDCIAAAIGSADTTFFSFNGFNQTRKPGRVKICKHYFRTEQ
jgi:RHS repeat-associated protein